MKLYIGENIRKLRAELSMTQEQLAARLGCTAQAVSKWETQTTTPDIALLPMIAQALDVRIDTLFEPGKTAYRHRGDRLLATYESDQTDDESYRAAKAELEKRLHENDPEDQMSYAYLLELRAWEYLKRAEAGYDRAFGLGHAKSFRQRILLLHKQGRDDESIEVCHARLFNYPDDVSAHIALAMALHLAKQESAAWEAACSAMEQFPDDAILLSYAGHICQAMNQNDTAFELWQRALAADPEVSDPLYSIALLHGKLGNRDEARAAWQFLVGWLEERGFEESTDWPRRELAKWVD